MQTGYQKFPVKKNMYMKIKWLLLLCMPLSLLAQTNPERFAKNITAKGLKDKLIILAGPAMQGRETATDGQRKAANFIEAHFKKTGLQPAPGGQYQLAFPVYQETIQKVELKINGIACTPAADFSFSAARIPAGNWHANKIIYAGFGLSDSTDYDGLQVKGKWVLLIEGTDKKPDDNTTRTLIEKVNKARTKDAAGVIIIQKDFPKSPITMSSGMTNMPPDTTAKNSTPVFYISLRTAKQMLHLVSEEEINFVQLIHGVYPVNMQLEVVKSTEEISSTNVVGILPGTDKKEEYVFITAHYDHLGMRDSLIYYGADDDGSGTVTIMQLAEAFASASKKGNRPRRSIVFMAVSGEEKGLWGSDYYTSHPFFPLGKTSVDLNIDMIGRIDPTRKYGDSTNYIYTIGDDKLSSLLAPLTDSINAKYTKLELDRKFNDPKDPNRFYYRSDHYNFAKHGVPVIFYFNGTHADYHRPTDTVDKIRFDIMQKRALLVYYTAWHIANRNDLLPRDKPLSEVGVR